MMSQLFSVPHTAGSDKKKEALIRKRFHFVGGGLQE
jgi:hypothetical protein